MSDHSDYVYPPRVSHEIPHQDHDAYVRAANFINRSGYDVLSVQHEYGIFGGDAGSFLMSLVREAKMPIVTTLHTVLREPNIDQRTVLNELLELSERVVVMSHKAVGILVDVHRVPRCKIDLIHHGIPAVPAEAGKSLREHLGIHGPMILTFGLLSPNKGIEYAIGAMPAICARYPGATYVVVGATHPHVRGAAGEVYRESLIQLAADLGVAENVRFVDKFVEIEELVAYLSAMDIYVTPYLTPSQITSGTLAYSVGAGKAVISTPYWYAEELLADGRGVFVPFRDAQAIADAVIGIQEDIEYREEMGRRASEFGRQMLWPEVGRRYLSSFARAKRDSADRLRSIVQDLHSGSGSFGILPSIRLDHLLELSDDTGILQHATITVPNRSEGYCVDDNARALLFTAYLEGSTTLPKDVALLQSRYLSFLQDAFNPETQRFRNFMSFGRVWLEDAGSEDSHGRSLWALGTMVNRCRTQSRREVARQLFERAAPAMVASTSPRSWAYAALAAAEFHRGLPWRPVAVDLLEEMSGRLLRLYRDNQSAEWRWFEQSLAYANARLPQALLLAGEALKDGPMLDAGLESLGWLVQCQCDPDGLFAPIGTNGFFERGGVRNIYDQQPIEAWVTLSACLAAHRITGDPMWLDEVHRAFEWFLGKNSLGVVLYDKGTGGCRDGLHPDRMNENMGAESTLSYLCSLAELLDADLHPRTSRTRMEIHETK